MPRRLVIVFLQDAEADVEFRAHILQSGDSCTERLACSSGTDHGMLTKVSARGASRMAPMSPHLSLPDALSDPPVGAPPHPTVHANFDSRSTALPGISRT